MNAILGTGPILVIDCTSVGTVHAGIATHGILACTTILFDLGGWEGKGKKKGEGRRKGERRRRSTTREEAGGWVAADDERVTWRGRWLAKHKP